MYLQDALLDEGLEILSLDNKAIDLRAALPTVRRIIDAGYLPKLHTISFANAALGDAGMQILASMLEKEPFKSSCKYLSLENNGISDKGIFALAEAMNNDSTNLEVIRAY